MTEILGHLYILTSENMTIHIILSKKFFNIPGGGEKGAIRYAHPYYVIYVKGVTPPPPPRGLYEKIALYAITSIDFLYSTDTILISGAQNSATDISSKPKQYILDPFLTNNLTLVDTYRVVSAISDHETVIAVVRLRPIQK